MKTYVLTHEESLYKKEEQYIERFSIAGLDNTDSIIIVILAVLIFLALLILILYLIFRKKNLKDDIPLMDAPLEMMVISKPTREYVVGYKVRYPKEENMDTRSVVYQDSKKESYVV